MKEVLNYKVRYKDYLIKILKYINPRTIWKQNNIESHVIELIRPLGKHC